jgi:hypothetical protein
MILAVKKKLRQQNYLLLLEAAGNSDYVKMNKRQYFQNGVNKLSSYYKRNPVSQLIETGFTLLIFNHI